MQQMNEVKGRGAGTRRARLVLTALMAIVAGLVLPARPAAANSHSGKGGGHMVFDHRNVDPKYTNDDSLGLDRIPDYFCTEITNPQLKLRSKLAGQDAYVGQYTDDTGTAHRGIMKYNLSVTNFNENPSGTYGSDTTCGGSYNPLSAGWSFPPTGFLNAGAPTSVTGRMDIYTIGGSTTTPIFTCTYDSGTYQRQGPVVRLTLVAAAGDCTGIAASVTETHVGAAYFGTPNTAATPGNAQACVDYMLKISSPAPSCGWSNLPVPARDLRFIDAFST